jgi:hypothetical protein
MSDSFEIRISKWQQTKLFIGGSVLTPFFGFVAWAEIFSTQLRMLAIIAFIPMCFVVPFAGYQLFTNRPRYIVNKSGIYSPFTRKLIKWAMIEKVELIDIDKLNRPIGNINAFGSPAIRVQLKKNSGLYKWQWLFDKMGTKGRRYLIPLEGANISPLAATQLVQTYLDSETIGAKQ